MTGCAALAGTAEMLVVWARPAPVDEYEGAETERQVAKGISGDALLLEVRKMREASLKLKGKVIEIGNLEDHSGRGMRLEDDGDDFSIIGLTEEECRQAAKWYGEVVEITIAGAGGTATHNDRVEGRDAASSRRVPSHDGLAGD